MSNSLFFLHDLRLPLSILSYVATAQGILPNARTGLGPCHDWQLLSLSHPEPQLQPRYLRTDTCFRTQCMRSLSARTCCQASFNYGGGHMPDQHVHPCAGPAISPVCSDWGLSKRHPGFYKMLRYPAELGRCVLIVSIMPKILKYRP